MRNFIGISRDIETHWVYGDIYALRVWLHILLKAQYKKETNKTMIGSYIVEQEYGEFVFGRESWSKRLQVPEQRLRTIMSLFEKEGMIKKTNKSTVKYSIFTVVNYSKYNQQSNQQEDLQPQAFKTYANQQSNPLPTSNQPATNQQPTTIEDSKIDNKENNNISLVQNGQEREDKPTKKKKKNDQELTQEEQKAFEEVWSRLPRRDGLGKVGIAARKNVSVVGKEKMLYAVDQYIKKIKKLQTEPRYVMMGSTFINSGYLDYIKGFVPEKTELELLAEQDREEASTKIDFTKMILGEGGNGFDSTGEAKR